MSAFGPSGKLVEERVSAGSINPDMQESIESRLVAGLDPTYLHVENESHMHAGPADAQTHFKAVVVSPVFAGKRLVARHQQVYALLKEQLAGELHALALHTYTEDEWEEHAHQYPASPSCLGGSKRESAGH